MSAPESPSAPAWHNHARGPFRKDQGRAEVSGETLAHGCQRNLKLPFTNACNLSASPTSTASTYGEHRDAHLVVTPLYRHGWIKIIDSQGNELFLQHEYCEVCLCGIPIPFFVAIVGSLPELLTHRLCFGRE